MHLNSKLHYGVRTLMEIALSAPDEGIFQKDISQKQEISNKYLDQLIAALKTKGLIRKYKGLKSGYVLNKPASEISIYEIYTAFDPDIKLMDCLNNGYECVRLETCALHVFCEKMNEQIVNNFKSVTLKDLLEGTVKL